MAATCTICHRPLPPGAIAYCPAETDPTGLCRAAYVETARVRFAQPPDTPAQRRLDAFLDEWWGGRRQPDS